MRSVTFTFTWSGKCIHFLDQKQTGNFYDKRILSIKKEFNRITIFISNSYDSKCNSNLN